MCLKEEAEQEDYFELYFSQIIGYPFQSRLGYSDIALEQNIIVWFKPFDVERETMLIF
jgi:hypothetical protein